MQSLLKTHPGERRTQRILTVTMFVVLGLTLVASRQKVAKTDAADMHPSLSKAPEQKVTRQAPFSFAYRGETYNIAPRYTYEIQGLVVSHNDIDSSLDHFHDENSVDTRDLGLIFGSNVTRNDWHRMEFWSKPFNLYYRYPRGVKFDMTGCSNSHLLTDKQAIRDQLATIGVGDQVRLKGLLVDYSPASNPRWVRRSSSVRNDSGNGACEVMFVQEVEVLVRGPRGWRRAARLGWWVLGLLALGKLGVWGRGVVEAGRRAQALDEADLLSSPEPPDDA